MAQLDNRIATKSPPSIRMTQFPYSDLKAKITSVLTKNMNDRSAEYIAEKICDLVQRTLEESSDHTKIKVLQDWLDKEINAHVPPGMQRNWDDGYIYALRKVKNILSIK